MTIDITNMYPGLHFLWYTVPLVIGVFILVATVVVGVIEKDFEPVGYGFMFLFFAGFAALFGCLFGSFPVQDDMQHAIDTQLERTGRYTSTDPVQGESNTYIGIRPDGQAEKFFLREEENNTYRILPIE